MSHVLRCILWHSTPRLTTAALLLVHVLFVPLLFVSVGCIHRLFIVPLPSATLVQKTLCPSSSVHISGKTVLKRSAKKKKIHSSSIPELLNHRYRCRPSLCPKHCSQQWNKLHPKTDNMERSRDLVHCSFPAATRTKESNGDEGAKSPKLSLAMCCFPFLL